MNRTTMSLIAAVVALAAVTGVATLADPAQPSGGSAASARLPVDRSTLLCPAPSSSDLAETTYTAFTPRAADGKDGTDGKGGADGEAKAGRATLLPAAGENPADDPAAGDGDPAGDGDTASGDGDASGNGDASGDGDGKKPREAGGEPVAPVKEPGTPVTATADGAEAPALIGEADGRLAPGWSVQQTTTVDAGVGRGLLGAACTAPDTEFWFPAVSTASDRQDYVHLTNPDDRTAVVDLEMYGAEGETDAEAGEAIQVPGRSTVAVLLATLGERPEINATLHVTVRTGRVGAAVQAADTNLGGDWLPASAAPAPALVLPGIPKDATAVRLVAYAPGDDADLTVRLAGPSGSITPAGNGTLHVKSRMTAALDLGDVTKGEPGSLVLAPENADRGKPVVAALRVTRGKGDKQETAYIPATPAITERGTVADNRAEGTTLSLVAPEEAAKVRITASATTEGGAPVTETRTVKAGTTVSLDRLRPAADKGVYAITVEHLSGGPVHAARMLALPDDGVPMFTVQTLPDDGGTVEVPKAEQDLSLLNE
ncbi:hypothetical protein IHE55_18500 [Streptomyces pactum]|uniref:Secreted protein n=1 Tax=Streptomyces pactum TaxID=68249 RepID=A0ABS0NN76_9ACTN|nr:DUF5719 family protein [Streptomyces pactum]MBH5336659.1 hypothetical protein [Streptomyces pactum]